MILRYCFCVILSRMIFSFFIFPFYNTKCYNGFMKIAMIGAGAFGTALGGILADKGHEVLYYDPALNDCPPLASVVTGADFVVLAAPSNAVPYLLPHLPRKTPLIVATKGVLDLTLFEPFSDVMALSGPGFADDIKAHKATILTATDVRVAELFSTEYLTFDFTSDFRGVLLCGALKNVYAIVAGRLGLEAGSEKWEEFIFAACDEMRAILIANGADPETVSLASGAGDLRLTCNCPSRNYEFGRILSSDPSAVPEKTVEGMAALSEIRAGKLIVPKEAVLLNEVK